MEERPVEAGAEEQGEVEDGEEKPDEGSAEEKAEENKDGEGGSSMADMDLLCCLLQPPPMRDARPTRGGVISDPADYYVGMRRLLLQRMAEFYPSAIAHRKEWRCNGWGYVAYRNYIRRPRNWGSRSSTPGQSGRWASPHAPQSILFDVESWSSSRDLRGISHDVDHRTSFSSSISDTDRPVSFAEPAYSFVGMHCIFDSCKAAVTILKFGHMSSDLLAYGASDGTLTVCRVSETPSILWQLKGHSKDVTVYRLGLIG